MREKNTMKSLQTFSCRTWQIFAATLIIGSMTFPGVSGAEKGDRLVPANPLGAGNNWKTDLDKKTPDAQPQQAPAPAETQEAPQAAPVPTPAPVETPSQETAQPETPATPEQKQAEAIKKIDNFFNTITYLEGRFVQTDSGNNKTAGKFYVKRPGRIRFDYDAPSNLRIVSDGKWLSIEDHDLSTFDRYPLETTPFKLLLKKDVNLTEDADILDFFQGDDLIIVTVSDKVEKDSGKIKLFFSHPNIQLSEWIITDPQGQDTRVELKEVVADKKIEPGFFVVTEDSMQGFPR